MARKKAVTTITVPAPTLFVRGGSDPLYLDDSIVFSSAQEAAQEAVDNDGVYDGIVVYGLVPMFRVAIPNQSFTLEPINS